ncbi:MAG: hypothetical protein ACTTIC_07410 [Helicobacteraceae bacterium]
MREQAKRYIVSRVIPEIALRLREKMSPLLNEQISAMVETVASKFEAQLSQKEAEISEATKEISQDVQDLQEKIAALESAKEKIITLTTQTLYEKDKQ